MGALSFLSFRSTQTFFLVVVALLAAIEVMTAGTVGASRLAQVQLPNATHPLTGTTLNWFQDWRDAVESPVRVYLGGFALLGLFASPALEITILGFQSLVFSISPLLLGTYVYNHANGMDIQNLTLSLPLLTLLAIGVWGFVLLWKQTQGSTEKLLGAFSASGAREGAAPHRFLTYAVYFRASIGIAWGIALVFNYSGVVAALSSQTTAENAAALSAPVLQGYARVNGINLAIACFSIIAALRTATRREATVLAFLAAAYIVHFLDTAGYNRAGPFDKVTVVVGIIQLVFLLLGVVLNEGVKLWEKGVLHPRNVIFLSMALQFVIFLGWSSVFRNAYVRTVQISLPADVASNVVAHYAEHFRYIYLVLYFVGWVSGDMNTERVTLFTVSLTSLASALVVYLFHASQLTTGNAPLFLIAVLVGRAVLAFSSLWRDTEGDLKHLFAEVFAWSYDHSKGGLYLFIIVWLVLSLMILILPAPTFVEVTKSISLLNTVDVSSAAHHLSFRGVGIWGVTGSFALYFLVRINKSQYVTHLLSFILANDLFVTKRVEQTLLQGVTTPAAAVFSWLPIYIVIGGLLASSLWDVLRKHRKAE